MFAEEGSQAVADGATRDAGAVTPEGVGGVEIAVPGVWPLELGVVSAVDDDEEEEEEEFDEFDVAELGSVAVVKALLSSPELTTMITMMRAITTATAPAIHNAFGATVVPVSDSGSGTSGASEVTGGAGSTRLPASAAPSGHSFSRLCPGRQTTCAPEMSRIKVSSQNNGKPNRPSPAASVDFPAPGGPLKA